MTVLSYQSYFYVPPLSNSTPSDVRFNRIHPNTNRYKPYGAIYKGDDGIEAPFILWRTPGWEVQPPQPPNRSLKLFEGQLPWNWNIDAIFLGWQNDGWEVQPFQPPTQYRPPYKGGTLPGPFNIEFQFQNWRNDGWEIQSPHLQNPALKIFKGWLTWNWNIEAVFVPPPSPITFIDPGPYTLRYWRPEMPQQRVYAASVNYVTWEETPKFQPPYFLNPSAKEGAILPSPFNIESVFVPPPIIITFSEPAPYALRYWRPEMPQQRSYAAIVSYTRWEETPKFQPPSVLNPSAKEGAILPSPFNIESVFVPPPTTITFGWDFFWGPKKPRTLHTQQLVDIGQPYVFQPRGWEIQDPQPPHPRPERAAWLPPGDQGNQATQINFYAQGWPIQYIDLPKRQPPRHPAIAESLAQQFIQFQPYGWEIQAFQPPLRYRQPYEGGILPSAANVEFQFQNWINQGWPVQYLDLPKRQPPRHPATAENLAPQFFQFYPAGWAIQDPQPPRPSWEKPGALMAGDTGTEATEIVFYPYGWEHYQQLWQRPRQIKTNLLPSPINIDATYQFWINQGWPIQEWQPPHLKPEKAGAIQPKEDGTEATFVAMTVPLNWGQEPIQAYWLPHPKPERFGAAAVGDQGNQAPVYFQPYGWAIQEWQPPKPQENRAGSWFGPVNIEAIFYNWINDGWDVQPPQPPHLIRFGLLPWSVSIDATFYNWINAGWQVQDPQPPHLKPEKSGAIQPKEDGTEAAFVAMTIPLNWGQEPIQAHWLPHPRPERAGSIAQGDQGNYAQYVNWINDGWPIQPPPPPHSGREKGANIFGPINIEYQFVNWINQGWPIQDPQPPHPKPERFAALAPKEDAIESPFVSITIPLNWGQESIQAFWLPKPRPEKQASAAQGDQGNYAQYVNWINQGWPVQYSDMPIRQPYRSPAPAEIFSQPAFQFYPYGWPVQPLQPPHFMPEKSGGVQPRDDGIESPFVFLAVQLVWGHEQGNAQPLLPFPRTSQHYAAIRYRSGFSTPIINIADGWDAIIAQPPHAKPEKAGALQPKEDGIVSPFIAVTVPFVWGHDQGQAQPLRQYPRNSQYYAIRLRSGFATPTVGSADGWDYSTPHVHPITHSYRFGSVILEDDGIELPPLPPVPLNRGFEAQDQHLRTRSYRREAGIRYRSGFAFPGPSFTFGWDYTPERVAYINPRHNSKFGAFGQSQFAVVNWVPFGWVSQDNHFAHIRIERIVYQLRGDIESVFVPPPPAAAAFGWQMQQHPQPPRLRYEHDAAIATGDAGIQQIQISFQAFNFENQPPQPPHPAHPTGAMAQPFQYEISVGIFIAPVGRQVIETYFVSNLGTFMNRGFR